MTQLEKAIQIAVKAHEGQPDKAGAAYILHPLRVMQNLDTETEMIVGVLHDVVEDSEIEHSIVLESSSIKGIAGRIADSLIGRNATVRRSPIKPVAHKITLGDHSDVGLL